MDQTLSADCEVDPRGPQLPAILRTKKTLNDMLSGRVLRIPATDPAALRDLQSFAKQTGHELVQYTEQDGVFTFLLRRK